MTTKEYFSCHRDACADAKTWALQFKTMSQAWMACKNPQWMLWALNSISYADEKKYRTCACRFVREVWHLLNDERSRRVVEITEAFTRGEASIKDLNTAWAAAWDTARDTAWAAARAAAWAAENTAWAAAWAAANTAWAAENTAWAAAWDTARDTAWAAARAAAWAVAGYTPRAAANTAWAAAEKAAMGTQADIIREIIGDPFGEKEEHEQIHSI